jgi:hypothetical protein
MELGFCIFAAGNGVRASLLAVASMYTNGPAQTNGLYTLLSLTDGLSHMLGAPFIQKVWSRSLELDKAWLVLPFGITFVSFEVTCDSFISADYCCRYSSLSPLFFHSYCKGKHTSMKVMRTRLKDFCRMNRSTRSTQWKWFRWQQISGTFLLKAFVFK